VLNGFDDAGELALHFSQLAITLAGGGAPLALQALPFGLVLGDELGHKIRCH
jgi:hypothetical protein